MIPTARLAALAALAESGVYLLFDPRSRPDDWQDVLRDLRDAGIVWFQLRAKGATVDELETWAACLPDLLVGATWVLNDDPDLAPALGASGVHVGAADPDPVAARLCVGADAIVGATGSGGRWQALPAAALAAVDYLGVGPLRASATKPDAPRPLGHDAYPGIVAGLPCPVVAIGGVASDDLPALRRAGVRGAAVASGIWQHADPRAAALRYLEAWRA